MSNLEITKQLACSKESLYKAWTEPAQLKQWWHPLGKQLVQVENNITEGGAVKYLFEDESLSIEGNYEKVAGHDLLEYTWNWHVNDPAQDSTYRLSVRFEGDDKNASIFITQTGFENEESIHPHQHGWEQGLEQLNSYVSGLNKVEENPSETLQNKSEAGYNEMPEQSKVAGG